MRFVLGLSINMIDMFHVIIVIHLKIQRVPPQYGLLLLLCNIPIVLIYHLNYSTSTGHDPKISGLLYALSQTFRVVVLTYSSSSLLQLSPFYVLYGTYVLRFL